MLDLSQVTSFTTTNDKLDKMSVKPSVKLYQDNIMTLSQDNIQGKSGTKSI